MLERMKKMLKKEKGFTLVELLAVIVILGIILAIAVPSISGLISNAEKDADESNVDLIENAARLAHISEGSAASVSGYTLGELENDGFLEEIPNKPGSESPYGGGVEIKAESDGNVGFTYTYNESFSKE